MVKHIVLVEQSVVEQLLVMRKIEYTSLINRSLGKWQITLYSPDSSPETSLQLIRDLHPSILIDENSVSAFTPDRWRHRITFMFTADPQL